MGHGGKGSRDWSPSPGAWLQSNRVKLYNYDCVLVTSRKWPHPNWETHTNDNLHTVTTHNYYNNYMLYYYSYILCCCCLCTEFNANAHTSSGTTACIAYEFQAYDECANFQWIFNSHMTGACQYACNNIWLWSQWNNVNFEVNFGLSLFNYMRCVCVYRNDEYALCMSYSDSGRLCFASFAYYYFTPPSPTRISTMVCLCVCPSVCATLCLCLCMSAYLSAAYS